VSDIARQVNIAELEHELREMTRQRDEAVQLASQRLVEINRLRLALKGRNRPAR